MDQGVPAMLTINIAKAAKSLSVDFAALPENSQQYIIEYGLRQTLNDATASLKKEDYANEAAFNEAALGVAQKKLDGILSGELRQQAGRIGDPVEAEFMRLAVVAVSNVIVKKGKKLSDYTMKQLRERAAEAIEAFPEQAAKWRATAEANVAAKAGLSDGIDVEV
jgi:CRISPR/Cas system CMR-associated protein Cmr5 small subunit